MEKRKNNNMFLSLHSIEDVNAIHYCIEPSKYKETSIRANVRICMRLCVYVCIYAYSSVYLL